MSHNEFPELQLKPIISYPREAEVGKTYLVSIDVQLAIPTATWDFPEEEYAIGFILNTSPYFTCEPLHEIWPTIILHRYGGTYGPAEFLLTAADHEIERGQISITLVNGWGIPMTRLELPCEVKLESEAQEKHDVFPLPWRQKVAESVMGLPSVKISPEEAEERERGDRIAGMLVEAGWTVIDITDTILSQATGIAVRVYPYISITNRDGTTTNTMGSNPSIFVLIINYQAVGTIIKEGDDRWISLSALMSTPIYPSGTHLWSSLIHTSRDPLPLIYEMQGEEINFTNNLEPEARSRLVFHFHRPETFALWLEQAPVGTPNDLNDLVRSRLRRMPPVLETTLSFNQFEAITRLESSLAQNRPRALVQMADSSAMIMNSIYRLLKFGGAKRVLYLVDSLEDTIKILNEFQQYILPDINQRFTDIYSISNVSFNHKIGGEILLTALPDPSSSVYIMDIENVYRLLSSTRSEEDNPNNDANQTDTIVYQQKLPIEFFDVIFFVECFDKLNYRYRSFLDYFDAFFIGVGTNIPARVMGLFKHNMVYQDSSVVVQRIWEYCDILRNEVASGDYLEQLTYLLYLKISDERTKPPFNEPSRIPKGYDWQSLLDKKGPELREHYSYILERLGREEGMLSIIFKRASNKIQDPAKLHRLIADLIDSQTWNSLGTDVLGDIYEGLLEKNAEDVKTGAGQYFTPRALIKVIVDVMRPEPGTRIVDPASGTGGFILMAHEHIAAQPLTRKQTEALKNGTFSGWEIVENTARLCAMNLFLHDIGSDDASESPITVGDSLLESPHELFDMVLSNPPFGRKSRIIIVDDEGKEYKENMRIARSDFIVDTKNMQLNFVQHIITLLKSYGRAAVVLPDNVLFEGGGGEKIRSSLLKQCDVHTLLRLPTGIFYAQGVKANVLFFDRMPGSDNPWTKELWIYDFRTNQNFTLRTNPLKREHLEDFVSCYHAEDRHNRRETERFRKFSYDELIKRDKLNLDIFWQLDEVPESDEELNDENPESDE